MSGPAPQHPSAGAGPRRDVLEVVLVAVLAAALSSTACELPDPPDGPGSRPSPTPIGVEVSEDPARLAAAREQADAVEAELLEGWLSGFDAASSSDEDMYTRFQARPGRLLDPLLRLRDHAERPPVSRFRAAHLLCRLGHETCWNGIRAALRGSARGRALALYALGETGLSDPPAAMRGAVVEALGDAEPDVRAAAINACEELRLDAAEPKLLAVLAGSEGEIRDRAAHALSQIAPSAEAARLAGRWLADPARDPQVHVRVGLALQRFAANPDPAVSGPAIEALAAHAAAPQTTAHDRAYALAVLSEEGGPEVLPLLQEVAANPAESWGSSAALGGLIRLGEPGALDRAFELLIDDRARPYGLQALAVGTLGSRDDAVLERLLASVPGEGSSPFGFTRLLQGIGTPRALTAALELAPHRPADEQRWLVWTAEERELGPALVRLHELGILPAPPGVMALEERARRATSSPDPAPMLDRALELAGVVHSFDAESDEVPSPHDLLLHELAAISGGAFAPEAVLQAWERADEDDWESDFQLQFVHADRLYRVTAQNAGDWYDFPSVLAAANRAVEDAERPGRFVPLFTGDQTARVLFADPVAVRQAADEWLLILESDPDRSRRVGQAFERLALEEGQR